MVRSVAPWFKHTGVCGSPHLRTRAALTSVPVDRPQGKTEEQLAAEQAWYLTDKVWLVHKDGFSLGQ